MGDPDRSMSDLAFGQKFRLFCDPTNEGYVAENDLGHVVAFLPRWLGGEVRTRTERWNVQSERRGLSWAVVARTIPDGAEAGGVAQRLVPNSYKLWIAPDTSYHLTQNPLNDNWAIRDGHRRVVGLTDLGTFATGGFNSRDLRAPLGTITTFDGPITPAPLALMILLALEMAKAQASIPRSSAPTGY
jgi:hypothetical protein